MSARAAAERLLAELLAAGAVTVVAGGRLRIDAPDGVLTAERREALAGCRAELRTLVAARWRAREECAAPHPCRRMGACAMPVDGRPCTLPATCCLCGGDLPPGRRYLCPACTAESATRAGRSPCPTGRRP